MTRIALAAVILAVCLAPAWAQSGKPKPAAAPRALSKLKTAQPGIRPDAIPGYQIQVIEGFTVVISNETLRHQNKSTYERKPLEVLDLELKTIVKLLPPEAVKVLRRLLIWVEWDEREGMSNGRQGSAAAVYYGGHQAQMLEEGKHPLKAKNITILSMEGLTQEHQPSHDSGRCVILHEMTHAVHDQFLGDNNPMIKAGYKQAQERKLYDPEMYAATNEHEYFAELTCAYFDQLNYYPRTRKDLEKHDPVTYRIMESIWGRRKAGDEQPAQVASDEAKPRLSSIDLGQPVLGPRLSARDLQGRVAMIVLWHAGSASSLACFQKLNAWHAELSDFGLVSVAVHLTGLEPEDVKKAAESREVAFPVTEAKWITGVLISDFNEFPQCLVFDPAGKCVFRGAPFDAETALRSAIGQQLVDRADLATIPKTVEPQVEALRTGSKPPSAVVAQLVNLARSADDQTAAAATRLINVMSEGGQHVLEQAELLATTDPVGAYLKAQQLPLIFKGTSVGSQANKLLHKLRREKVVAAELRAWPTLAMVRTFDTELGSRPESFDPTQKEFRQKNAELLAQLRDTLILMKKSWPDSQATAEALKICEKYGWNLP